MHLVSWRESQKERVHWDVHYVGGLIMLSRISSDRMHGLNWNRVAQNGVLWRTLVNAVMDFRIPLNKLTLSSVYKPDGFSSTTHLPTVS
jgi:hypothetical protein